MQALALGAGHPDDDGRKVGQRTQPLFAAAKVVELKGLVAERLPEAGILFRQLLELTAECMDMRVHSCSRTPAGHVLTETPVILH